MLPFLTTPSPTLSTSPPVTPSSRSGPTLAKIPVENAAGAVRTTHSNLQRASQRSTERSSWGAGHAQGAILVNTLG